MTSSLVGSEMCIRDSLCRSLGRRRRPELLAPIGVSAPDHRGAYALPQMAVSYTHLTLPTICSV
eukprot:3256646-Prorocentrum_lima.AAC.1